MSVPAWKKTVSCKMNKEFISIKAYSGYRSATADPVAEEYFLNIDVCEEILGEFVLEALQQSRFLELEEMQNLNINSKNNYENWVKKIQNLYGYKTRRAMFRWMKNCHITLDKDILIISPSYHERIESWGDGNGIITEKDDIKIPADSTPEEIGAALRLAFDRCKSRTF